MYASFTPWKGNAVHVESVGALQRHEKIPDECGGLLRDAKLSTINTGQMVRLFELLVVGDPSILPRLSHPDW